MLLRVVGCRDGNGAGRGRTEGWGLRPCPTPHNGENSLTPSPPLGAPRSPVPPRKTLHFVNFSYN